MVVSIASRKAYLHKYYLEHKEQSRIQNEVWKKQNPERFKENQNRWRLVNHDRVIFLQKRNTIKTRLEVLTHYGGGKLSCVRCGFNDERALSIDHINGNKTHERGGVRLYYVLKSKNYPLGYRTLCMNCQVIVLKE